MSKRNALARLMAVSMVFVLFLGMVPLKVSAADYSIDIVGTNTVAQNQKLIQDLIRDMAPGDIVTISGTVSNANASMTLDIPDGVTVKWRAFYIGSPVPAGGSLINLTGNGAFEVEAGWMENLGSGITINATGDSVKIVVSGTASVGANTGNAIYTTGLFAAVTVRGNGAVFNKSANNIRPAIYMYNQNNVGLNVIVTENGSVGSIMENASGYAIQTYGNVEISGNAKVFAMDGRAINALGANSTVEIKDNCKVWSDTGIVIRTGGMGASVIVSGGEVYNDAARNDRPVIYMEFGSGLNVVVSGTGKVQAKGNTGRAVETTGSVSVEGNALVSATTGNAINATGVSSYVSVNGGVVSTTTGNAINATGVNAVVNIGDGQVSATTGNAVNAAGSGASVSISGGQVSATTGYAVNANAAGAAVNVSGGFVFAYGAGISNVVRNPLFSSTGPYGAGIVTAWEKPAIPEYPEGSKYNLLVFINGVADVSGTEDEHWTVGGISYGDSTNPSFFAVPDVIVTSNFGLVFNVDNGKFYFNESGDGSLIKNTTQYIAQNSNYAWDSDTHTLTLNGFSWNADILGLGLLAEANMQAALIITSGYLDNHLTIELVDGSINNFTSSCSEPANGIPLTIGIAINKNVTDLTITGGGTLEAVAGEMLMFSGVSTGIIFGDDTIGYHCTLTIEGGTVIAQGGAAHLMSYGMVCENGDIFINGGAVTAVGDIVTATEPVLVDLANPPVIPMSVGIVDMGSLTVSNSTLTAAGASYAMVLYAFPALPSAYTYWKSGTATPTSLGAGTLVYPAAGSGSPYIYGLTDRFVRITAQPVAVIDSVTVSGEVGKALPVYAATITVYGDTVNYGALPDENAASWFVSDIPGGITVTAEGIGANTIGLTFGGAPRNASTSAFNMIIPGSVLTSGMDIPVQYNPGAKFDVKFPEYVIILDPDDGSDPSEHKTITTGEDGKITDQPGQPGQPSQPGQPGQPGKPTLPIPPSRPGYEFIGWFTEPDGQGEMVTDDTEFFEDMTIYAYWRPISYGSTRNTPTEPEEPEEPTAPEEPETPEKFFEDVFETDWFYDDVYYVYGYGLMLGTSTEPMLFDPDMPMTRGMIVTVLYRLEGSPDVTEFDNPFTDVAEDKYYTEAVKWAANYGVILGYSPDIYGPEDDVTREQLAAIIYRYEYAMDKVPMDRVMDREFADWNTIRDYAKSPVNKLTMQGLIFGKPGNLFDPRGHATRAEFAAILHRYHAAIA